MATFLAGTYTTGSDSKGIYRVELEQDRFTACRCIIDMKDPSYMTSKGSTLYVVSEDLTPGADGQLFRFIRSADGQYRNTGAVSSAGVSPCHVAVSPDGREVIVSNYVSGSVSRYQSEDLSLIGSHKGSQHSVNTQRQSSSHAHQATWYQGGWLICDLGGDCLWRLNRQGCQERTFSLPAGVGPRHLVIVNRIAYIGCELSNELLALNLEDGKLLSRQTTLGSPCTFSSVAAVRYQDSHLFVSNRGEDTVSVFSLENPELPTMTACCPTGDSSPRDILVLPHGIVCACAHGVTWLKKQPDGSYQYCASAPVPSAVALLDESVFISGG